MPEGWKIVRFNEIAKLINGRAYLMPELQETGKYRIVRVGNFSGKDEWFYSDMELEDNKYCESGDLLYKWACNFGPEIWNEEKVIYHYHIWKVIPNKNNMKKMFY
ncbi:MAG: restriction endonuclease subunit S [Treponema sp.]|nr:restriction endonuclease subunit S [Treponema sp.]